ncbi:MAG TPA: hypothetical protein VII58_11180, partial [Acidobacteriaceae bacterium]
SKRRLLPYKPQLTKLLEIAMLLRKVSMLTLPLTLLVLCSCATTRTTAVADCPQPPALEAAARVPAPDPQLFPKCLQEALQSTSVPLSAPSCEQLADWLDSTENSKK